MYRTVFLNAARLNFDQQLNFTKVSKLTTLTTHPDSNPATILSRVQEQDIVVTKELPLGSELISQFPASVRLICEAGTGYNNIDLAAASAQNIMVCNIPNYSTSAVAQLVITFLLTLSSSLVQQQVSLKQGDFTNFTQHLQVPHREVLGKTLGIIGAGTIGQQVSLIAQALGMNLLVYSRTPKAWGAYAKFVSLEELLQKSDFITLHCPLTEETRCLINKETLQLMKPSAFLINTSRGAIVHERALIEALQNKQIAGAALDVQDPEPPALDNPLFQLANVLMTPHIGWRCLETRQRLIDLVADNIASFAQGKPINLVNG